jgi:hypothetical protein
VSPRRAVSPDGRIWRVEKLRERLSFAESGRQPFFWASAIAAILLIAFWVRLVTIDVQLLGGVYAFIFGIPLLLWLVERTLHLLSPRIRAETDGPPHELVMWKTMYPFRTSRLMNRAVAVIEAGRHDDAPRGLDLVELSYR